MAISTNLEASPEVVKKILPISNVAAAVLVTVFFCVLKNIAPDPYLGYTSDFASIGITLMTNLAIAVPFLLMSRTLWTRLERPSGWLWLHFVVLASMATFLLWFLWGDQFQASRGFGLIAAAGIYLGVFIPIWIAGFLLARKRASTSE